MNPTPHLGMLMIPHNLSKANLTHKGWQTSSRLWTSKSKLIPFNFSFFLHSINYLFLISCLSCLWIVQNLSIHGMVVLLPWSPNMSKRTFIFTYLHVMTMFVVQMSTKQPFSHITIGASIEFANPPWPLMDPIYIFHGMIWWYFSMITLMQSHLSPYKFLIKPTSLHYEGIIIKLAPKP